MEFEELERRIQELRRKNCSHKCHTQGLNPWVKVCPICGCPNQAYDKDAVVDFGGPREVKAG